MKNDSHLNDLVTIRVLMERSTRFISLSGLSGVFAGIYALAGAYLVYSYLNEPGISEFYGTLIYPLQIDGIIKHYTFFLIIAAGVLFLSMATGIFFTARKASRSDEKVWNPASRRMLINLLIPLATGGVFCIQLLNLGLHGLVGPAMLIFYGLALINGSKYTLEDIRYLGISEIILGLISLFFPGYGLLC